MLKGKTVFITGGSRGIGKAIALRLADEGANIVVAAKTAEPHPKLPGTVYTAAKEIEERGGQALPLVVDVRHEEQVEGAVRETVARFGGIDILVNNASAIFLAGTVETPMKRYDLMHQVNVRATYLCSQKCIPYLKESKNPHILNLSPPLSMQAKWFQHHTAYTMTKFGMSMCVLGMAKEFEKDGIAVNALWPKTTIATAAVRNLLGGEELCNRSRHASIMGDASYHILTQPSREFTGRFLVDEDVLREQGVTDFESYSVVPGAELAPDFFLD